MLFLSLATHILTDFFGFSFIIKLIKLLIKSKALVFIGTNWKIYLTYYLTHSPREGCLMSATSIPIFTYKYTSNTTLSILQIHIKLTEHNKYNMIQKLSIVLVYGRLLYCLN